VCLRSENCSDCCPPHTSPSLRRREHQTSSPTQILSMTSLSLSRSFCLQFVACEPENSISRCCFRTRSSPRSFLLPPAFIFESVTTRSVAARSCHPRFLYH